MEPHSRSLAGLESLPLSLLGSPVKLLVLSIMLLPFFFLINQETYALRAGCHIFEDFADNLQDALYSLFLLLFYRGCLNIVLVTLNKYLLYE